VAAQAPAAEAPTGEAPALPEVLEGFVLRSRLLREGALRGAPMPPVQRDNWLAVLASLDWWMGAPEGVGTREEAGRMRRQLEVELAEDARRYRNVPADLSGQVLARLERLAPRPRPRLPPMPPPPQLAPRLAWPLETVAITSEFGLRRHPIIRRWRMHAGVDLAARLRQPVFASAPGVVVRAGRNGSHGLQVEVDHGAGVRTRYSHLSRVKVRKGQALARGELLGLAGRTGRVTGVHLHFEVWRNGRPVDPLEVLEAPGADAPLTVSWR
jgi:murein DD-endopeptidase MepM/ murein hydrolase activator NlpD